MEWKDEVKKLLSEEQIRKLKVDLMVADEWDWSVKKTLEVLTFWKQPFSDEFKQWLKDKIKRRKDLERFSDLLSEM